jgi:hypothetical protein
VKTDGLRVLTQNAGDPNLTLMARPAAGLSVSVVEGRQDPVQGWLTNGISAVRPAPVAIYQARGKTTHLLYAMVPAPAGEPDPLVAVEAIGDDPGAARIVFRDGRKYDVRFTPGKPAAWKLVAGKAAPSRPQ